MKKKQILQIGIFPKLFNVISFYSKGQYSIKISVIQQDEKGNIIYAFPVLIQNRQAKSHENKKAQVAIENNTASYTTQQFYITYNEQTIFLNTMATFKLEFQPNKSYKTYIDFSLLLTKFKIKKTQKQQNQSNQPIKKVMEVDSRRIHINKIQDLHCFKKIIFSDCEYFSFLDVYLGSVYLGNRFRLNDFQLTEFSCMNLTDKTKYHLESEEKKQQIKDSIDKGRILKEICELQIKEFYHQYMSESFNFYLSMKKKYKDLTKMIQSCTILGKTYKNIINNQLSVKTTLRSKAQLELYYETQDQNQLFYEILQEIQEIDKYTLFIWQHFLTLLQTIPFKLFAVLVRQNFKKQSLLKERLMISHSMLIQEQERIIQHEQFLTKRKQILDNLIMYEDDDVYHPFLMIEGYENPGTPTSPTLQINSLVVFVHGYQGSDFDLEKARNFMMLYSPNCYGLLIKSIQDQIEENIEHLGEKVANQIKAHISGSLNNYKRINLIGYSLGGVVIRQAIKNLREYQTKMNIFATFASPHLGVSKSDNYLVGTGIWYLANVEKVKNMRQLNCQTIDEDELLLKKLSTCDCLGWFKKVVLVSSKEDNFVPYYSSRINEKIDQEDLQWMAENIRKRVKKLQRMEVWFDVEHDIKTIDKMLGRRAHIEFLQNRIFLDIFFKLYGPHL